MQHNARSVITASFRRHFQIRPPDYLQAFFFFFLSPQLMARGADRAFSAFLRWRVENTLLSRRNLSKSLKRCLCNV
jgi:hypothetical protein